MKRKEFQDKIETAAKKFEDKLEDIADRFDKKKTLVADSKFGRIIFRWLDICVIAGLIAAGGILLSKAQKGWAIVCFILGGTDFIWEIIELLLFED